MPVVVGGLATMLFGALGAVLRDRFGDPFPFPWEEIRHRPPEVCLRAKLRPLTMP